MHQSPKCHPGRDGPPDRGTGLRPIRVTGLYTEPLRHRPVGFTATEPARGELERRCRAPEFSREHALAEPTAISLQDLPRPPTLCGAIAHYVIAVNPPQ